MRALVSLFVFASLAAAQAGSPEQLFQDALAAQQRGDDALAIRKYQELIELRPDVPEVRANLGAVLARQGRFDEAIAQYRAALAGRAPNPAIRINLALACYKKGDFAAAAYELESLRASAPGDLRTAMLLADCYARLKKDDRVIAILAPLESSHADDLSLAWMLGSAFIRAGRRAEGLERVETVARRSNSPEAYLLAGQAALKLNQFERARGNVEAAMRINPRIPGLLTLRGTVRSFLGDNPGAISDLRAALDANPDDFEAHLALGAALVTERDLPGARRHLVRALALNPASTLARYEIARLERVEGNLEAALKDFEKVVQADPRWAQPHIELSALYFRLNRREDGERERAAFDRLNAADDKQ